MEPQVIGAGGAINIPPELLERAHLAEGSVVCLSVTEDGAIAIAAEGRDPDQAWFWTEEWQRKEREADEDIAAGRVTGPMTGDEFLAELRAIHERT
jgi:antitoxin component of MazEF toxin-antitoxin module